MLWGHLEALCVSHGANNSTAMHAAPVSPPPDLVLVVWQLVSAVLAADDFRQAIPDAQHCDAHDAGWRGAPEVQRTSDDDQAIQRRALKQLLPLALPLQWHRADVSVQPMQGTTTPEQGQDCSKAANI
jgi:hypothetical protein